MFRYIVAIGLAVMLVAVWQGYFPALTHNAISFSGGFTFSYGVLLCFALVGFALITLRKS